MKFRYFLAFTILLQISSFAQGGWTQNKGNYYVKLSGSQVKTDKIFDVNGNSINAPEQGLFSLGLYGEYGRTDNFTLIGYVPLFTDIFVNENIQIGDKQTIPANSFVIGDIEVGGKLKVYRNDWLATALTAKFRLPTGRGEFNQMLIASAGFGLPSPKGVQLYGNIYGGVNNRARNFSTEQRFGFEIGAGLFKSKLWIIAKQDNILSFNNAGDIDASDLEFGLQNYGNNFENQSYSIEASYFLTEKFGINFNYSNTFAGQLIYDAPTISAGIFWNKRK